MFHRNSSKMGTNCTQKCNRERRGGNCSFASVAKFDTRQVATAIVDSQGVEEKGRQTDTRAPSSHLHLAGKHLDMQPGLVTLLWGSIKQRRLAQSATNSLRNTALAASLPALGTFRRHTTQHPPHCEHSSDCQPSCSRHLQKTGP